MKFLKSSQLFFVFVLLFFVFPCVASAASWAQRFPSNNASAFWTKTASDDDGSTLLVGSLGQSSGGRLYVSNDGGLTFSETQPAGDVDVNWGSLASDADGSNLIVGASAAGGRLYISEDGGSNWTETQPVGDVDRNWIAVASDADGSNLIAAISSGRLYTSSNGGDSWVETQPAGAADRSWRFVASDDDGTNLFVGAASGRLYTSINGGANWTERQPAGNVNKSWGRGASDDDGTNLIVGSESGRLYTSINGGANWTERQPAGNVNKDWLAIDSGNDGSHLIAGAYGGRLYVSSDSGANWTEEQPDGDVDVFWYGAALDSDGSNIFVSADKVFISPDTFSPVVYSFSPPDNSTDVPIDYIPSVTFDQPVAIGTGFFVIKKVADDSTVESIDVEGLNVSLSGDATTITFNPSINLGTSTEYYILADAGVVKDYAENPFVGIADPTEWNFTTSLDVSLGFERVSVDDDGVEGNLSSERPAFSSDGRYVAFQSIANNLVLGDSNDLQDIFFYDRVTDNIQSLFIGDGESAYPSLSGNARIVAFSSDTTFLEPLDANGVTDIFTFDRILELYTRVSVDDAGEEADGSSSRPALSTNGRFVAFESSATNLVPNDTNGVSDVFVYDRYSSVNRLQRVSVDSLGDESDGDSNEASISSDGRYIAFSSYATTLVSDDTNGTQDIFVYDQNTDTVERVSVDDLGNEGNGASYDPFISGDGRYVSFVSDANNLVVGDDNGVRDVFLYDRQTDSIERFGDPAGFSEDPYLSRHGRYITYTQQTETGTGIYLYDRDLDTTLFVTEGSGNNTNLNNNYSGTPILTPGGLVLGLSSYATNLVIDDTNDTQDVFVTELGVEEDTEPADSDPEPPILTVTKIVVNDDGGTLVVDDFDLMLDRLPITSGVATTTAAGTYTITEDSPWGYAGTFSGDCDASGDITMLAGEVYACTLTNDDNEPGTPDPATLTVTKTVLNNGGGIASVADFPLTAERVGSEAPTIPLTSGVAKELFAGAYQVHEDNLAGYTAGSWGGDCAADGTITVTTGNSYSCTITNDDDGGGGPDITAPVITRLGSSPVNLTVGDSYTDAGATALDDTDGDVTADIVTVNPVNTAVAGTYTVTYNVQDAANNSAIEVTRTVNVNELGDPEPATLTVTKIVVNDDEGTSAVGDFDLTLDGLAITSGVATTTAAGTYTVAEDGPAGYTGTFGGDCDPDGSIVMTAGNTYTCTLTNDDNEPGAPDPETLTVSKDGTGSGTVTSAPSGINCGVDCAEDYAADTVVTLTASATAGSEFIAWTGGGCAGTGACIVTMSEARSITATFNLEENPGDDDDGDSDDDDDDDGGGRSGSHRKPIKNPPPFHADTNLLESLQARIEELKAILAALLGSPQGGSSSSDFVFMRDLDLNAQGPDVTQLQLFLIAQNKGPQAQALGVVGATGLLGPLTWAALAEYQVSVGITPAVGYFGPITRAYVNGL
ncbi:MAG: hypothetical protein QG633_657 [Patescibacteria group bacterium]|jgi:Tol biopolymer transport system component|nr:hypothetical protein [Patescibacteria group bacterium]